MEICRYITEAYIRLPRQNVSMLNPWSMCRNAITGLLHRTQLSPSDLDYVVVGNVIQEVSTANVAKEAALGAGVPTSVPCHTVTQACISSNQAISTGELRGS